jgi:hypothetical protein
MTRRRETIFGMFDLYSPLEIINQGAAHQAD